MTGRRFGFVQWEFAGRLGPDPGRYPVRRFAGDDVREIVVIGGLEAPRRSLRPRRRRPKAVPEPGLEPVEVFFAGTLHYRQTWKRLAMGGLNLLGELPARLGGGLLTNAMGAIGRRPAR